MAGGVSGVVGGVGKFTCKGGGGGGGAGAGPLSCNTGGGGALPLS